MIDEDEVGRIAERVLAAGDAVRPIPPISDDLPGFDLAAAYRIAAAVTRLRIARGERPLGWKIGFTNETIWDEYGVHAPIWGPMYDSTFAPTGTDAAATCPVESLSEPRLEPEIAFRLGSVPDPDMDEGDLLGCVETVGHGIEIVQSIFPGWRFRAPDTVAAFALHGRYRLGPLVAVAPAERSGWRDALSTFTITLFRDGVEIDRGAAGNVLGGGPLTALRHFVRGLAEYPSELGLRTGDIVTTGTVTRAFPVEAGERWTTKVDGLPLPGMDLVIV